MGLLFLFSGLFVWSSFLSLSLVGIQDIGDGIEVLRIQGEQDPFSESSEIADAFGDIQIGIDLAIDVLAQGVGQPTVLIWPHEGIEYLFLPVMKYGDELPVFIYA